MIGIIAEKPSQARNFCKALLGSESKTEGVYKGEHIRIVPLRGHLYELVLDPDKQAGNKTDVLNRWSLSTLPWDASRFAWKMELRDDCSSVVRNAHDKLDGLDEVVIATDDDPGTHEGSGLACEVIFHGPIRAGRYSRMYFVDESAKEVRKAFENRKLLPNDLATWGEWKVAWYRNRWDYLAGLQATRAASVLGDGKHTLRNGRLKSAIVRIVGDQLKLIEGYRKVPYFQNRFRDDHGVIYVNPEEPQFKTKTEVPNSYKSSSVVVDSKTMKRSAPPRLMDLAGVAAVVAPKGISSNQVLKLVQSLYEKQILSYPRTEDKTITPEQFDELAKNVDAIARVVGIDPSTLTHRLPRKTHVKPKGAHGANRPGPVVPASLAACDAIAGKGAGEVYAVLARSALAMFAEDYEYEAQKGHVADYPAFVGSANVPKADGWHAVLGRDLVDEDADESAQGLGSVADPFVHEGYPPKPQKPTMRWLMKQLEKRDVGTGATRTSTYSEVTSGQERSKLLNDRKGTISMAAAGEVSYRLLPGTHIGSLDLTEGVFAQMRDIEAGRLDPDDALMGVADLIRDDIATMRANAEANSLLGMAELVEGTWNGREVRFKGSFGGHTFTNVEIADLLAGRRISFPAVSARTGKEYTASGLLAEQTYKGRKYVGFKLDLNAEPPREVGGRRLDDDERQALMEGRCIFVDGLTSKKTGRLYGCGLSWTKSGGLRFHFD